MSAIRNASQCFCSRLIHFSLHIIKALFMMLVNSCKDGQPCRWKSREKRFATVLLFSEISIKQRQISFNHLSPRLERDQYGNDIAYHPPKIQLRSLDIVRLIKPYVSVRLNEQVRAVLPLAIYLVLFQLFILKQNVADHWQISAGLVSVIIGLNAVHGRIESRADAVRRNHRHNPAQ